MQEQQQEFQERQPSGLPLWVKFLIGFLVLLVLTFLGLFLWRQFSPAQNEPDSPTPPPPETAEQKAAREATEAAAKAAALTTDQSAKEQATLDADLKAAVDRLTNMNYEVGQTKAAVTAYALKIATPGADPVANQKAALLALATQRERALASAGWGANLASAIETRAKVLKKDTDPAVSKTILQLRTTSDAMFAALANSDTGTDFFKDANSCVGHMTKDLGIINCPARFNTFYSYGVNAAGDCPDKDGLCNRCTGFEFPKQIGGRDGGWNSSQWAVHSGKATATAKSGEGKLMSYSGIYVVDGQPQAYEKCA